MGTGEVWVRIQQPRSLEMSDANETFEQYMKSKGCTACQTAYLICCNVTKLTELCHDGDISPAEWEHRVNIEFAKPVDTKCTCGLIPDTEAQPQSADK